MKWSFCRDGRRPLTAAADAGNADAGNADAGFVQVQDDDLPF